MREILKQLAENYWVNLVALLLLVLILFGWPVPSGNEYVYLIDAARMADPDFLSRDWTYAQPWYSHLIFSITLFPLMKLFSLETATWLGRLAGWLFVLAGLLRLAKPFRLPLWQASLAVALWLLAGQSVVAAESVLGTLEAKLVAWGFLFFALDGFLRERVVLPAILLGMSFNFHPVVGMWGAIGVGVALIALRLPMQRLARVVGVTAITALPGLLLSALAGFGGGTSGEDWAFYAQVVFPGHLDPFFWDRRAVLLLALLFVFHWLHARHNWDDRAIRFLFLFQSALGAVFALGVVSHIAEQYRLMQFMPFRLFPVFALLLFFLSLFHAFQYGVGDRRKLAMGLVALLALLGLGNPLGQLADRVALTRSMRGAEGDDLHQIYRWAEANTPRDAIIISPPWRKDSYFASRRAQVVNSNAIDVRRFAEWRERMEALLGGSWRRTPEDPWGVAHMDQSYTARSAGEIREIAARYGGDYLVSRQTYGFPEVYSAGDWKLYQIDRNVSTDAESSEGIRPSTR